MDEYYISREDWDTIVELGVDQNKDDIVLKKVSAATKTSFTKKCVAFLSVAHRRSCEGNGVGTMRANIRYRSIERWIWARRPRSWRVGPRLISKRRLTCVHFLGCV